MKCFKFGLNYVQSSRKTLRRFMLCIKCVLFFGVDSNFFINHSKDTSKVYVESKIKIVCFVEMELSSQNLLCAWYDNNNCLPPHPQPLFQS